MKEEIKVTNSEWYVMNCLWEKSHLSLMQLVPLLKESAGWSKSTSATMVRRMTEKDLIGYEENGKTKYFFPKVKKEDILELQEILKAAQTKTQKTKRKG